MGKVVSIQESGSRFHAKPLSKSVITGISREINFRMEVLKRLPKKLQYHFVVNKRSLIKEWDSFYPNLSESLPAPENKDEILLRQDHYNKLLYFTYYIGSFYKHNGEGDADANFVKACYLILFNTIQFVDGEEFDYAAFYERAFNN